MKKNNNYNIDRQKSFWGLIFVIPSLLFFAIFSFYPILNAVYMSLFKKNLLSLRAPQFVGFKNYLYLFSSRQFLQSVKNSAIFSISTFLLLVLFSLFFAVLISNLSRFQKFFQMVFYSPAVLSSVVAALIWLFIFDPRGLANQGLNFLANTRGVDYKWLASTNMLRLATILVYFWKYVGYFTIIFIAGIGSIPASLYEASKIDGATSVQEFFYITLPLLKPTTLLVSIMAMVRCLKTFSTQYLFTTAGAPSRPINVITLNIYNTAIQDHRIGLASAMSILLFIVLIFLAWVQLKISKSDEVSYQ